MMKYKIYCLLAFIIMIIGVGYVGATVNNDMPLLGKVIYLDAGHGGCR